MRLPVALVPGLLVLLAAGCRNCDLVEAELRTRERELRELHSDFLRVECENEALHREIRSLRQSGPHPTVEEASQSNTVRQIVLGRQTGGVDEDNCPGDEALSVVVEPRDGDGHALKAPGKLYVEALEINREGLKSPLGTWELSEAELRRTWRSGLLSTGYHVTLPWKNWPTSDRLRVVARLTLPDGRAFEADKDVRIRLTAAAHRKLPPAPPPALKLPDGPEAKMQRLLPWPRKTEQKDDLEIDPAQLRREGLERTALWTGPRSTPILDAVQMGPPVPVKPAVVDGWRP